MASPVFISKSPPGFSLIAILRGIQLGLLGAYRSLQNPEIFQSNYYHKAISSIKISIASQILLWAPLYLVKIFLSVLNLILGNRFNINSIISNITYFQKNILNLNVFLITLIKFFRNDLDEIFLMSLKFIDKIYIRKHPDKTSHQYYSNLVELSKCSHEHSASTPSVYPPSLFQTFKVMFQSSNEFKSFLRRYLNNLFFNLLIYILCKLPRIGSIILNLLSFQNFNDKIGTLPSLFTIGLLNILPKHYSILFLTVFWGSRNMVHDLLLPFFTRIKLTNYEKDLWIKSREGVLCGFGLCYFYLINQFPWLGILIYGFAESSAAYLITKISDPPPNQSSSLINWNSTQLIWNKEKQSFILTGNFINSNEGFKPFPGSFVFHPPKDNHLTE